MADDDPSVFEGLAAIFQVNDVVEAIAFYRDVLGFDVGWVWGDPISNANVRRDRVDINFGAPERGQTVSPSSIYVSVTNIDAYHDEVSARGANIVVPIGDRPYGMRDFTVEDPSGNTISYGQPAVR